MFIENYYEYAGMEWECVKGWIPHANSILGFFSGCVREWGFGGSFSFSYFLFFFAIAVNFNYRVFLIGVQCALTLLWLPAQPVLAALCAVVTEGQHLQVSRKSYNGKINVCMPLGTSESVSVPETCHPFSHISIGLSIIKIFSHNPCFYNSKYIPFPPDFLCLSL